LWMHWPPCGLREGSQTTGDLLRGRQELHRPGRRHPPLALEDERDAEIEAVKPASRAIHPATVQPAPVEIDGVRSGHRVEESHGVITKANLNAFDRVPPDIQLAFDFWNEFIFAACAFVRTDIDAQSVFGSFLDEVHIG